MSTIRIANNITTTIIGQVTLLYDGLATYIF